MIQFLFLLIASSILGQQEYYRDIDFDLSGLKLKGQLAELVTKTHTKELIYKEVWSTIKITDVNPSYSTKIILIYGYIHISNKDDAYDRDINHVGVVITDNGIENTYMQKPMQKQS